MSTDATSSYNDEKCILQAGMKIPMQQEASAIITALHNLSRLFLFCRTV